MESTDAVLKRLGASLTLVHQPCKTIKDVLKLCEHVVPCLAALYTGPEFHSSLERRPELLSLMVQLQIPTKLLQFMALVLRAGYPATPLRGSARATSLCAATAWCSAAEVMSKMLAACCEQYRKRDADTMTCKVIMAQLHPFGSLEPPGTIMPIKQLQFNEAPCSVPNRLQCSVACRLCAIEHCRSQDLCLECLVLMLACDEQIRCTSSKFSGQAQC